MLYPYQAQRDDELSIKRADVVTIVYEGRNWCEVSRKGQSGKVPGNYIEKIMPTGFLFCFCYCFLFFVFCFLFCFLFFVFCFLFFVFCFLLVCSSVYPLGGPTLLLHYY